MFQLKPGVRLANLSPQMALAAQVVASVYASFNANCTITSANDSTHMNGSLHYKGNALDFRVRDFSGDRHVLAEMVEQALGRDFDVLLESVGTPNEHLHVEYDPK